MVRRIGILTGGGDCPGLNPAIKAVVETALDEELADKRGYKFEVLGIKDGWRGLVRYDSRFPPLPPHAAFDDDHHARILVEGEVRTWDRLGGTRLGSSRTNPFKEGRETWPQVLENCKELGLYALVAIGGDDTLSIAARLTEKGANVVCIPKTIDRDLKGTDYSLGFETAVNVIVEEIDRIRTTANSHSRTFVVETMGRDTGHLALSGGLAAGADIVLIPEVPFSVERVIELLRRRKQDGQRYSIVVVAEGAKLDGSGRVEKAPGADDQFDNPTLGGVGRFLEKQLEQAFGGEIRSVNLSHLQRGGVPCARDRRWGRSFGIAAMDLVVREQFGRMVNYMNGRFGSIEIPKDLRTRRCVDVAVRYDTERYCSRYSMLDL
ncbi:MAG: ATP-dependent 6-phosphofructokinase [Deltaproteobacteria bacterium]|nr:ATP-dependent 6-phosphofructokinase [Deltaproteobacteria bacterium]